MPPLLLATLLTAIYALMAWAFFRQRRQGVIHTRMGEVARAKSPRHFAALDWLNIVLLPVGGVMLLLLWIAAISRSFA